MIATAFACTVEGPLEGFVSCITYWHGPVRIWLQQCLRIHLHWCLFLEAFRNPTGSCDSDKPCLPPGPDKHAKYADKHSQRHTVDAERLAETDNGTDRKPGHSLSSYAKI